MPNAPELQQRWSGSVRRRLPRVRITGSGIIRRRQRSSWSKGNIVSGSRVLITRDDTSAVLYNDVPGTALDFETGYIGDFTVIIRKASASPYYREFTAGGTTVANQTTSIKALQQLDE